MGKFSKTLLALIVLVGCTWPTNLQANPPSPQASPTATEAVATQFSGTATIDEMDTPTPEDVTPTVPDGPTESPTVTSTYVDIDQPVVSGGSDWPQLGYSPQRTSYFPTEVAWPWKVKWVWNGPATGDDGAPPLDHLKLPKGVQPITGGGLLYVGHNDGFVRAISDANGEQVWISQDLGGAVINTGAYDGGTDAVYFGAQNGKFYMLDAQTGEQKRVVDLRGSIDMAPLLAGGAIYVGSQSGILYALDKNTLEQRWSYDAEAALVASPAYSANHGGLVIILAENKSVIALAARDGKIQWKRDVNADVDPVRGTVFADTFPVVSDANDIVVVRSFLSWEKIWQPDGGAPTTAAEIREFLTENPTYQSLFVLNLADGSSRFVAPVLIGGIGNGGDLEAPPPQVVIKQMADGSEIAYLLWRNRQSCTSFCDGRSDNTLGEMDLGTGNIRFVQDHKDEGNMRMPTDEQSPLSMAGEMLFHAHWQLLGALKIIDPSSTLGGTITDPIRTQELSPVLNTLAEGQCGSRSNHYCGNGMTSPGESYSVDPGFYVYHAADRIYDMYWTTPVRSAVISNGTIYWKSVDGAIIALTSENP